MAVQQYKLVPRPQTQKQDECSHDRDLRKSLTFNRLDLCLCIECDCEFEPIEWEAWIGSYV